MVVPVRFMSVVVLVGDAEAGIQSSQAITDPPLGGQVMAVAMAAAGAALVTVPTPAGVAAMAVVMVLTHLQGMPGERIVAAAVVVAVSLTDTLAAMVVLASS